MGKRRGCEPEIPKINKKFYDIIELVYILNRLSDKKCMDEKTRQYLIGILRDVDLMKFKFDNYICGEQKCKCGAKDCNLPNLNCNSGFMERIIFFLKSLNEED